MRALESVAAVEDGDLGAPSTPLMRTDGIACLYEAELPSSDAARPKETRAAVQYQVIDPPLLVNLAGDARLSALDAAAYQML